MDDEQGLPKSTSSCTFFRQWRCAAWTFAQDTRNAGSLFTGNTIMSPHDHELTPLQRRQV